LPAVRDLCPQFAIFARSSRFLPAVRDLCPQFAIFARSSYVFETRASCIYCCI
jgi:hypothetical protein